MATIRVGNSTFNMPSSYAINPGSTFQTYNTQTGQTTYGAAPAGFAAGATAGNYAAVETPKNLPATAEVYQGALGYQPYSPQTAFYDYGDGLITSPFVSGLPALTTTTPANTNKQWQILNPELMKAYTPDQYQRLSDGRVVLNPGVVPKEGTVKETSFTLPNTPPGSVDGIQNAGQVNAPTGQYGTPDISNVMGALAGFKTGDETLDKITAGKTAILQAQLTQKQGLINKLAGRGQDQTTQAINSLNQMYSEYMADRKKARAELEALTVDYNNTVAVKDAQIAQAMGRKAPMSFINNQLSQIERNAAVVLNQKAANINAKTATLSLMNEDYNTARSFLKDAADLANAQYEREYQQALLIRDMNKDLFDGMSNIYKDAYDYRLKQLDVARQDNANRLNIVAGLIENNYKAGININDSLETAFAKYQRAGGELKTGGGGGTPTPKGITVGNITLPETGDTWTDTINYLDALKKQGMLSDVNYNQQINGLLTMSGALVDKETGDFTKEARDKMESDVNKGLEKKDGKTPQPVPRQKSVFTNTPFNSSYGVSKKQTTTPAVATPTKSFWSNLFGL